MKYLKSLSFFLVFGLLIYSCSNKSSPTGTNNGARGAIIQTSTIGSYSAKTIELYAKQAYGFTGSFVHDVTTVKIEYQTVDWNGDPVDASGMLVYPADAGSNTLPLMSLQHGTVFLRDAVASVNPLASNEGLAGIAFASTGYVVLVPDYLGYGVSKLIHPYLHAASNANVVIDFIRAARSWCEENHVLLNGQLFLGGYSEGGYVTLATQRAIETNDYPDLELTAVAPCAGPYDLYGMMERVGQRMFYPEPAYICFMLTAYNEIYGWQNLSTIFQTPYAQQMTGLFDGMHNSSDIHSVLPDSISQILSPGFIAGILNGQNREVIQAFQENTLLDWTPVAPIRFFQGGADQIVDPENAKMAEQQLKANGGQNITLVTYPNLGHAEAAIPAYRDMLQWFSTFLIRPQTKISLKPEKTIHRQNTEFAEK